MTRTRGWLAAVVDIVLIVAFALIGRSSHAEAASPIGLWTTAYPFLAGWAVGWLVVRGWARPMRLWPTGVVVWVATVAIGMLLRVLTGQGDVAGTRCRCPSSSSRRSRSRCSCSGGARSSA